MDNFEGGSLDAEQLGFLKSIQKELFLSKETLEDLFSGLLRNYDKANGTNLEKKELYKLDFEIKDFKLDYELLGMVSSRLMIKLNSTALQREKTVDIKNNIVESKKLFNDMALLIGQDLQFAEKIGLIIGQHLAYRQAANVLKKILDNGHIKDFENFLDALEEGLNG